MRTLQRDAEKGLITPARPQSRQDAPIPELRSRLAHILNVPYSGNEPVSAGLGWVGENRYACGVRIACGLVGDLFEHPATLL
jgi:hypothetical protein